VFRADARTGDLVRPGIDVRAMAGDQVHLV
jgi:hypothetical protein